MMKARSMRLLALVALAGALIASVSLVQAATAQRQKPAAPAAVHEPDIAYGAYQRGFARPRR